MMIECAKNSIPLGVRRHGEGAYLFCPIRKRKHNADKVTMAECQQCEHHQGVHEVSTAIPSDILSHRMGIPSNQPAKKRIVLSSNDIKQYELKIKNWLEDEMTRIAQVFKDMKPDMENAEEKESKRKKEEV